MATSLLKLTMTASAPTTTANPTVKRFFYTSTGLTGAATYTIDDTSWLDDSGTALLAGGLTPVTSNNGFAQLFINGVLQEGDVLSDLTTTAVEITFGAATDIESGKIIVLAVTNFAPTTTAPVVTG